MFAARDRSSDKISDASIVDIYDMQQLDTSMTCLYPLHSNRTESPVQAGLTSPSTLISSISRLTNKFDILTSVAFRNALDESDDCEESLDISPRSKRQIPLLHSIFNPASEVCLIVLDRKFNRPRQAFPKQCPTTAKFALW